MKKIFNIMMMACMVMMAACSSDDDMIETENVRGEEIVIKAGMNDTRVNINGYELTWNKDENLLLLGFDEQDKFIGTTKFHLESGSGTKNATFKGFLLKGAAKYKVLVYNSDTEVAQDGTITGRYNHHVQDENNDTFRLRENLRIEADGFKTAEELKKGVTLKMTNCIMRVDLRSLPEGCNANGFIKMFANFGEADQVYMGCCDFTAMGTLQDLTDAAQHNYIYIPFEPATLKSGKKLAIQFGTDKNDTSIFGSVSRAASADKAYAGGSMYDLVVESTNSGAYTNSLYKWKTSNIIGADDNQIWVKFVEGATMPKTLMDYDNITYTLSDTPNTEGWYVYSTKDPIFKAQDLFNGEKVGKNIIAEVWLPESMTTISNSIFAYNESVTNVKISSSTVKIDEFAFYRASALTEFVVPATVKSIKSGAFGHCGNASIPNSKFTILAPKETLTEIDGYAFDADDNLNEFDLYIHHSWKNDVNVSDNTWNYMSVDKGVLSHKFRSIHLIDDNGNEIK